MRGFTKAAKIFISIMAVLVVCAAGILVKTIIDGASLMIPIIVTVGALAGLVLVIRTATKERDEKIRREEEEAANDGDSDDSDDIIDY